jgi:hypothetical protein
MAVQTWRKKNWFAAFSATGKQQSAMGTYLATADIDTRHTCEIEISEAIERGEERDCQNVNIVGRPVRTRLMPFRITYRKVTPTILAFWAAYKEGGESYTAGSPADEVQTLTRTGTVSGGTFTLSLTLEGRTGITNDIAWNATPAQVQAALYAPTASISKLIQQGDVVVTGDWTGGMVLTFGGRLAKWNLPILVVGNGSITGGGTVDIAQTTAGAQRSHVITRSTGDDKILFSFVTGDINSTVAQRKYGDAYVDGFEIQNDAGDGNVGLVVTGACNYNYEELSGYSVPACVNPAPLRTTEVRVQINSVWWTVDVVSHTVNISDNVPQAALFRFDDVDPSVAPERGNQPSQLFTGEFYGDEESALRILAESSNTATSSQTTVVYNIHYGHGGNRFSIIAPEAYVYPQSPIEGFAGELEEKTVRVFGEPWGVTGTPVNYAAAISQSTAFLTT